MISVCSSLTVDILLVPLQALDDPGVGLQAALPQLVEIVHHVIVRLKQNQKNKLGSCCQLVAFNQAADFKLVYLVLDKVCD